MNSHRIPDEFVIPNDLENDKPRDMSNALDLLKMYSTWKFEEVAAWTMFIYTFSDELMIENMHLTQTLILNLCDTSL
jgi:hypothetical protein